MVAVIAGLATWALWPAPPRQREYLDATACLLTDEHGITTEPAKSVWTSMQDASVATLVRVQYLPVNGPQTADNAAPYLASLATGNCGTVIATGPAQVDAVTGNAGSHRAIQFLTVGGGAAADNVQVIDAASVEALRAGVRKHLEALADAAN